MSGDAFSLLQVAGLLTRRWRLIVGASLCAGFAALGGTYLVKPTFTAVTSFLSPQQQPNPAASALASFGGLVGLVGTKSPAEYYVSLMRSTTVMDQIVDRFNLINLYEVEYRIDARQRLDASIRMKVGKKDNIIIVEVDDTDPARAASIANAFVDELKEVSKGLALSEAKRRRAFFEEQAAQTRARLAEAQARLQTSGFNADAIKTEPKATTEAYARVKAEADAAEVRLNTRLQTRAESSPEIQVLRVQLAALQSQLRAAEASGGKGSGPDYIANFREFKYQETLHELFAKQFEAAKLDESRDSTLFQVIDKATPPEKRSKPRRAMLTVMATAVAAFFCCAYVLVSVLLRRETGR